MARTLEVFVPVSVGKKRGKRAGETFYLLQGSFLRWRNGGFYSFALRTSGAATIKSRRSIKRQATNFRRLGRTSTPRGWRAATYVEKKRPLRNWRKARGDISSRAENARKFSLTWETSRCAGHVGLSSFSMRWLEYLTAGFLWRRKYLSYIWRN